MFTHQVREAVLAPKTTFVSLRAELGYAGFVRTASLINVRDGNTGRRITTSGA